VDVADAAAVDAAAETVERRLGPIELWVTGPMAGIAGEFLDVSAEDFERVTAVTYHGTVNGTRAALARMVPRDRGHVVLLGSAIAHHGVPLLAAYSGAKAATRGFGESVAQELRMTRSAVRISMLEFPAMDTPQYRWIERRLPHATRPIPVVFTPEACARAVMAVVRRPRARTWVAEPTTVMALGGRIWPGGLDAFFTRFGRPLQQSTRHDEDMLPGNLWEPTPGDVGTRGAYGREALRWSPQLWAVSHRRTAGALAAAGIVWAAIRIADRSRDRRTRA
jgi:NAD(P)-dependent dehydrogenase (short-subunit alcohol dehydrogenase family)